MAAAFKDTPLHVVGFTRQVPRFMTAADAIVCKPGPGVVTEAAALGVPVVRVSSRFPIQALRCTHTVCCHAWPSVQLVEYSMATLSQEEAVGRFVAAQRIGTLWRRDSQLPGLVRQLFQNMGSMKAHETRRVGHGRPRNEAVFEMPHLLAKVLAGGKPHETTR